MGEVVGEAHIISAKAATRSGGWLVICGMGKMGVMPTACIVFVHLTIRRNPGGTRRTSPLHVCLVGSKLLGEGGVRLLCLSITRNPKVSQTFMGGTSESRLDARSHNGGRRGGTMRRCQRSGVLMIRSAALGRDDKGKLSSDSGARPSWLCRNLTPET